MDSGVCTLVGGIMEPTYEEGLTKEAQGFTKTCNLGTPV